ncbi:hypothetical protein GQ53DRAFT_745118 [Thozetella sp. PMI_491]|nr:hypothetical protein GQ53DRAFT_745118 [Thozetella sp. PMI_491]
MRPLEAKNPASLGALVLARHVATTTSSQTRTKNPNCSYAGLCRFSWQQRLLAAKLRAHVWVLKRRLGTICHDV